jgi:hypothetical protein
MGSNCLAGDWDGRGFAVEDWVTGKSDSTTRRVSQGAADEGVRLSSDIDPRQRWKWRFMVESFAPLAE